jgi:hypothetical protein
MDRDVLENILDFFPFSIQNIYLQMWVKNNLASQKSKQSDTDLIKYYPETRHILFIIIVRSLYSFFLTTIYFYSKCLYENKPGAKTPK